jgi:hypothetical protein
MHLMAPKEQRDNPIFDADSVVGCELERAMHAQPMTVAARENVHDR